MDKLILLLITGLATFYIGQYLYHSLKHYGDEKCGCHGCGSCGSCADCSSGRQAEVPDTEAGNTDHNPVPLLKPK